MTTILTPDQKERAEAAARKELVEEAFHQEVVVQKQRIRAGLDKPRYQWPLKWVGFTRRPK